MSLVKNKNILKNRLLIACIIFALIGFIDSTYLTVLHYKNIIPPCSITNGCETVLTSKYSTIYSIPVSLIGSVYYLIIGILSILNLNNKAKKSLFYFFFVIAGLGLLVSITLLFLQLFAIKAFCQYCLISETASFIIFILLEFILKQEMEIK